MDISIVGGGIGGLALANSLEAFNINYHLFRKSTEVHGSGGGYRIK